VHDDDLPLLDHYGREVEHLMELNGVIDEQ